MLPLCGNEGRKKKKMKFLDLLLLSLSNLKRRKLRTALTVFGVLIGTASVVTMISIGIGLRELSDENIAQYGSITAIDVHSDAYYDDARSTATEPLFLKDETIDTLSKLEHVRAVAPMLTISVILKQGIYIQNTSLIGAGRAYLEEIKLGQGALPDNQKEVELIFGNRVILNFENAKTKTSYYDNQEMPKIDYMNKPVFTIFDTNAYYQSQNPSSSGGKGGTGGGSEGGPGQSQPPPVKAPKKYPLKTAAVEAGDPLSEEASSYTPYGNGVYCDVDALKATLKRIFKNKPIPGQPTTKKGKPYKYIIYSSAVVYVDDMKYVSQVQKLINEMGFQTSSKMEWIKQNQASANITQMVLGGIGAVSLFVAAIGIANTMMMSIYERTKEIGIMKVLGCDMNKIRDMFLIESGSIGFIGGLTGITLSFIISLIINSLSAAVAMTGIEGDLSRIPLWLVLSAIVFAVFVGMLAGFFPAIRAMRLSPLSALRND